MTYGSSGNLTATFGANLAAGVYTVGIRARDIAGNWSPTATSMLVIYDSSTTLGMTGKNKKDLIPSLANGDTMPGLISDTQTDAAIMALPFNIKTARSIRTMASSSITLPARTATS